MNNNFAILTCFFNPCGYRNRQRCYERFASGVEQQGGSLWVIEATLPGQTRFICSGDQVWHVDFPQHDWIWQKERLLNLLIGRLPPDIDKIAWVDCDLLFHHDDWIDMARNALDTWPVIQLFDFVYWLGPDDEKLVLHGITDRWASLASVAAHYPDRASDFRLGTPGFAWAARREVLEKHGLYETDVTGGNDAIMAAGLYGWYHHQQVCLGNHAMRHDARNYMRGLHDEIRGYVGYIPCTASHLWHGAHSNRAYNKRRRTLGDHGFDPFRDLEDDQETGLLRWTEYATPELRAFVHGYFHSRREDGSIVEVRARPKA